MNKEQKKKLLLKSLAKITKMLRKKLGKSQVILAYEYEMSNSTFSLVEREKKDPQYTTLVNMAEAFEMKTWEFIKMVEEDMPEGFSLVEK